MNDTTLYIIYFIGAAALIFFVIPFSIISFNKKFRKGKFKEAAVTDEHVLVRSVFMVLSGGGSVGGSARTNRLRRIQLQSGEVVATYIFKDADWKWEAVFSGIAWFSYNMDDAGKIMGLETKTLQPKWNTNDVLSKLNLPEKTKIVEMIFRNDGVSITDNAARKYELHFSSFGENANGAASTIIKTSANKLTRNSNASNGHFSFSNQNNEARYQVHHSTRTLSNDLSFILPEWLKDWPENSGAFPWSESSVVFYNLDVLEGSAPFRISLLTADGQIRWTFRQELLNISIEANVNSRPEVRVHLLATIRDRLVLVTSAARKDKMFALELSSGNLIWERDL